MIEYLNTLQVSIYLFPLIAALITIPYLRMTYKKYNGIPILKTFIFYTFILYLTCCYILVIFPLPDPGEVSQMTGKIVDFRVLGFLEDIIDYSPFVLHDPSTWIPSLHDEIVYQAVSNFVMLIPFGIYLRYYFRKGFIWTFIFAFLLSLSFELIQLSALFGLYVRPYRVFQVDDLILNTSGALLGWLIEPLLTWMLPNRDRLDQITKEKVNAARPVRRFTAALIDYILFFLFMGLLGHFETLKGFDLFGPSRFVVKVLCYALALIVYFVVVTRVSGASIGKHLTGLTVIDENGGHASFRQLLFRYGIEMFIALPAPIFCLKVLEYTQYATGFIDILLYIFAFIFLSLFAILTFQILLSLITGNLVLFSEKMSMTRVVEKGSAYLKEDEEDVSGREVQEKNEKFEERKEQVNLPVNHERRPIRRSAQSLPEEFVSPDPKDLTTDVDSVFVTQPIHWDPDGDVFVQESMKDSDESTDTAEDSVLVEVKSVKTAYKQNHPFSHSANKKNEKRF